MEERDGLFILLGLDDVLNVVDIGANPIDGDPPYKRLLNKSLCRVVGFEPQADALSTLCTKAGPNELYLPYAVGNGDEKILNLCYASGMTSTLQPNENTLSLFNDFTLLGKVTDRATLKTTRLDDVNEISRMDFLKIDVQGSELEIFQSGISKLQDTVAVHTEVSFVPLYEEQPTFGEVDLFLRSLGFLPHAMVALKRWPLAPLVIGDDTRRALNQLLEADIVYVRDFTRPTNMHWDQWKRLAFLAHHVYGSFDLAARCISICEQAGILAEGTVAKYVQIVNATLTSTSNK